MKLHFLGVNGPFPESGGATSGYLVESGTDLLQLDLGSGVLSSLTALTPPESISALFITHWHFDHTADVPVLMYRLESCGRTLPVFGPADPSSPLCRLVSTASCFAFTEMSPGSSCRIGQTDISAFAVRHPVPSVGFRIASLDKTLCYTGDTNTLPSLADDCRGCTLLLADGLFPEESWSASKPHLSAGLAARLAVDTGAEKLIITHLNPFFPRKILLEEARTVFPDVLLAEAGTTVVL
jgi:ribonuclease BN (tRNA processing enzyme)